MIDNALCDQYGTGPYGTDVVFAYQGPNGSTCKKIKPWVRWDQVITGLRFWTYRMDIDWCWNATRITSVNRNRYADIAGWPGNPWNFEGHIGSNCNTESCSDKANGLHQTITTQGKMHACAYYVVFCKTKTPYIEVIIRRGGGFTRVATTP